MQIENTDDDLYASIEPEAVDPQLSEPTPEELLSQSFDEGVDQVLKKPEDEQEAAKALIAGLSEEEVKALLEKARRVDDIEEKFSKLHDKAFGTIGNLKQTVEELRNRPAGGLGKLNIPEDAFNELVEYTEDDGFAKAFVSGLQKLNFEGAGSSEQIGELLLQHERKMETRLLDFAHPDWRDLYQSEDFANWRNTLKPEAQEIIDNSWDGAEMAKAFSNFKTWKAKRSQAEQDKQNRLEQAITPSGSGRAASQAAEDAFSQGLKKVVSQRHR